MLRCLASLGLIAGTVLAGCAVTTAEGGQGIPEAGGAASRACTVSHAKAFVGQPGDSIAERAREAAGARTVRVIRPGMAVTMDYRGDRLNLKLDDKGVVIGVTCG